MSFSNILRNTATRDPVAESLPQYCSLFTCRLTEWTVRISEGREVLSFDDVGTDEMVGEITYECNIIFVCDGV